MVVPLRSRSPHGSNTRAEARHDDNDRNLHLSLQGDGVEVSPHPSADLVQVRLDLLQLRGAVGDEHKRRQEFGDSNTDIAGRRKSQAPSW
jgi:hypothetical protein